MKEALVFLALSLAVLTNPQPVLDFSSPRYLMASPVLPDVVVSRQFDNDELMTALQRETLINGDTESATRTLLEVIPNYEALFPAYHEVMACVPLAQGELDVDALAEACPSFHRWHAELSLSGSDRPEAIVGWMAQKLWEAPDSPQKEYCYCQLLADVSTCIADGDLERRKTTKSVCSAIYAYSNVEPHSIPRCLIDFLANQAKEVTLWDDREEIKRRILELRDISRSDQQINALTNTFTAYYRDESAPYSLRYTEIYITRAEYMAMPDTPLHVLKEETEKRDAFYSYTRNANVYGRHAVDAIIARYEDQPAEVTTIISSMVRDNVMASYIAHCLTRSDIPEELVDIVLLCMSERLRPVRRNYPDFIGICWDLKLLLRHLAENNTRPEVQKHVGEVLVDAGFKWEQSAFSPSPNDKNEPLEALKEGMQECTPEVKEHIQSYASQKLHQKQGTQQFTPESWKALETNLGWLHGSGDG